ncbi:Cytoplasmic dynein 1 heavy chain 1 [Sparganum proliferum]
MAPSVEKKIAELEIGLLHLQQNIDIPEITLAANPYVVQIIKKRAEEGMRAKVTDFEDKIDDAQFLNGLQGGVNRWIKEIQKVTNLDRDPSSGTALQEITFWLNLERALARIQEKRESLEITLTLEILKHAKRFHATVSFDADTGLTRAIATVTDYNPLMKDFPLNDLLSATELDKIKTALQAIFNHLRKIRNTKYPLQRALKLIEALSRDLTAQLLKVLGTRRLMHMPYEEFERVMTSCFEVFSTWDDEYEKLQGLMREIGKKKREEQVRMIWRLNFAHRQLQNRLDNLRKLWYQHEQLRLVIVRVRPTTRSTTLPEATGAILKNGQTEDTESNPDREEPVLDAADASAIDDVNMAFELVKEVDCLDLSKEGTDVWEATIKRYEERIDRVETRIAARLRDLLGTAKSANEMFRYFSRFNALFVRPHIRGAIREYQTQLIKRVKDDIEALHNKFKMQYRSSRAYHISKQRDIPPVAGSIIWARQIEEKLNTYLRRVEDVLGRWSEVVEKAPLGIDGCQLEEVDSFKYLGARLLPNGQSKDDTVSRIDAARWVFSSLRKCLWNRRDLSIATKIRVYRASVRSVLLYGCECWALRVEDERKLEIFNHHCLRIILRVKFTDFVPNETVRARCNNIARITQAIQERRLRWFGHVLRRPPQELSVTALDPAPLPHWRRRKGGQFKTWLDTVRQDMEVVLGPSVFGLRRWRREWVELSRSAAADRHAWRGKGWEHHREGKILKEDGDNFKSKLNTNEIFEDWCRKVQQKPINISGRIFSIEPVRAKVTNKEGETQTVTLMKLNVTFMLDVITLAKEVRSMKVMGFRVPLSIVNKAHQTSQLYPSATSLNQSLQIYEATCAKIDENNKQNIALLCAGLRREVQGVISEGILVVWESYRLSSFVQKFAETILQYQEKVEDLLNVTREIDLQLKALETCAYTKENFQEIIGKIQKLVDDLNLHQYSNLAQWVATLDNEVEKQLLVRLKAGISEWTRALRTQGEKPADEDPDAMTTSLAPGTQRLGGDPKIKPIFLELRITNQQMHLYPSIEVATQDLFNELASWQNIILNLPRIQHSRYQVGLNTEVESQKLYRNLISTLCADSDILMLAHEEIRNLMDETEEYVKTWTSYQTLWDLQSDQVYARLGTDLETWMDVLIEIKEMRKHFDVAETQKAFGPICIIFGKVQSKVTLKYDSWHKEILSKFGNNLGNEMQEFYSEVSKARNELEQRSVDSESTGDAVSTITYTQSLKRKMKQWDKQVALYRSGQNILFRDRFQFPSNWLDSENIQGEWSAFQEILRRKESSISSEVASLQIKIVAEDKVVETKTAEMLASWQKEKPIQGNMRPDEAVKALTILEGQFLRLKEERGNLQRAKEALELTEAGVVPPSEERVQVVLEELQDLKNVWIELSRFWDEIEQLRETPWQSVQPRKIRQQIDEMVRRLKEVPARLRHYAAYEHIKKTVQGLAKVNALVIDLKSEALKERHWRTLIKRLNVNWVMSELTLGQLWDVDLQKNESIIREVFLVAQGEKALEEFLKQVTEVWKTYELDLVVYQNRCRLIRGWDDLFNRVKEHINSVTAMKLSPYFKQFEEEALAWEDRLNRINALFDVWIDVQRRWVYLDGIFSGSADIKTLLAQESQRFSTVSTEFLGLLKKVSKSPLVMDVLNIPNVQRQLERLADLLSKIQRSLGEYLERQRSSFPRFYFVGDEDLLEIIGNSKNIPRLQKHFKKMFAGVHSIKLNEECTEVLGLVSKEGEEVDFAHAVSIKDNPVINDWLRLLEQEMRVSLATYLARAVTELQQMTSAANLEKTGFLTWLDKYQAQLVVLASQICWSEAVEGALASMNGQPAASKDKSPIAACLKSVETMLTVLADTVLYEQPPVRRRKLEHLIIEHVHQRDVLRSLLDAGVCSNRSFDWLSQMRFYFDPKQTDPLRQVSIQMANAKFAYGFEYLGVMDRLVQTPLTDRCYLTMTQALEARLGGSPFGPAGTGKTESVKALGMQLGRFVLVFNCDETFDFHAMGRIFVGLCQVGAWGCFDEFNRLEERMLSAVSQQIQGIQEALRELAVDSKTAKDVTVELLGKNVSVNPEMAIFITMNPGYAGRSNLPDNLKKLFRSLAMTQPDRQLIAQVMLYSQGFRTAELLSNKVVPLFKLCDEQLSPQPHYDFGLRALKSVLVSAGNVKRDRIRRTKDELQSRNEQINESAIAEQLPEQEILIQSIMETMVPKLVAQDIPLLYSLLSDVFPGVLYCQSPMEALRRELRRVCEEMYLVYADEGLACTRASSGGAGDTAAAVGTPSGAPGTLWVEKVLQLYQITCIHHGLMMVGPSGSGKSMAWRALLKALERVEGVEGVAHVIDPKSISKDSLYGYLDPNTREWTDGLFTHTLRKIIDSVRGESLKRQWIIFDGDVDPEWVENLNSVLDDNKLLTLPNGERLGIPPNVRIMFEVQNLKYATLATVSRCGMVWFSEDVVTPDMVMTNFLRFINNVPVDEDEDVELSFSSPPDAAATEPVSTPVESGGAKAVVNPTLQTQRDITNILAPYFTDNDLVSRCLEFAKSLEHIMDFTTLRALTSLFSMLKQTVRTVLVYNATHSDFPMSQEQLESFVTKSLVSAIIWSLTGDSRGQVREQMCDFVRQVTTIPLPPPGSPIIDFDVSPAGEWVPWAQKVPVIEVESHKINTMDVVVPTLDTVRHEALLYTWLAEHRPMVLCGPPGSGKTMTLFSALRSLPDMEVVGLNFSSATTPELMLKTFDQYCEYRKTPNGIVLAPQQINKWLIFFCDEINLPNEDKYGTQRVISFLRQMLEHSGFYQTNDMQWVRFERIQFVGACNPPTDPGRKPLSHRFLRHVPVVYVDYPGETSLKQIYGTFNRAMLRMLPSLRSQADALTNAMVDFFLRSQKRFTVDMQPHYIYSPRELTRWVRGIHEALKPLESLSLEGLVRIWAHEALRLFQDRLIEDSERFWTDQNIDDVAMTYFPHIDRLTALQRPILFSNWLSKDYVAVDQEALRDYVKARLKVFYEEELDVPLVLFNQVLDHVLRIDRVFRQAQGHLLLIGISGAGKTTLSRFVSWVNGLSIFQVKVHNKYTAEDFDEDLRNVLRRAGCKGEKITFIMDESNVMDSSFLERMNTLLANGEVPGLFEGDEFAALMTQCKEGAAREGLMIDSQEELYKWFTNQICRNLHVVFTMNPSSDGLKDKAATSPALFNRCVLNWFGDWSLEAYFQVGKEFTSKLDLERADYTKPEIMPYVAEGLLPDVPTYRDMVVNAFVFVHQSLKRANDRLQKRGGRTMAITPRHYLDFISHYVKLIGEKRSDLEEQQLHLNVGLQKIKETVGQVEVMQKSLTKKSQELEEMNAAANAKLKQMVSDQQEAEQKKTTSQSLQVELEKQREYIKEKRALVMEELSQVEPAVNEAKHAVEGIRKKDLQELKSMRNPPPAVKMALEAVCLLLGEKSSEWLKILQVIVKDSFVPSITNYNTDEITDSIRETMKKKYLENPDFNFEKVNRASSACGPMVKWVIAQISYADILKKVEPLRNELKALEEAAGVNEKKAEDVETTIAALEKSIARYKDEYAVLISQAQSIKADLASVEAKVERSVALIKSLSSERTRWEAGSETFRSQMATIIGDCLLSSAFMAYGGYFDQSLRLSLLSTWAIHLKAADIQFRADLARVEYLSNPDERLRWQANALPNDELCVENAIILRRFNRYPLIIDPSGQATEFLLNEYKGKKIAKTSFLDDAFRKTLESSLRFGTPLLVQDVESYDPILNPVLNREVRRTGGRTLITLGDQDIDLSPTFTIFLSTRDPSVEFAPDICSRVTFVNFTVTHSSLQSQCLNAVLKAERPDVDNKRSDLLKMQGEFQLRLRHLEKDLLQALNDAEGNLLDDDKIITNLETLKKEAGEVAKKVEETDAIMAEVDSVSQQYVPLAQACSAMYFTLDTLNQVHFLYQYSLQFMLDIFNFVLTQNENLKSVDDSKRRLEIITKDLFQVTYSRVARGMLHRDQITFAILLIRIFLKGRSMMAGAQTSSFEAEFGVFLHGQETSTLLTKQNIPAIKGLTQEQCSAVARLQSQLPAFKNLVSAISSEANFSAWVESVSPETEVPVLWEMTAPAAGSPVSTAVYSLLLIQALRPDRLLACCHMLVSSVLGQTFMESARAHLDLGHIVENEIKASVPVLLCAAQGFDPSGRIEDLAADLKKTLTGIAIGSAEGFSQAEKVINTAVKQGKWVMLKNVHLAPSWLVQLEKKLHSFQPHPSFRLFLTMEINPKLPVNLLRTGRVFVFEPPPGMKASLLRTFANIPASKMSRAPAERSRLYFLLAWFHAVVQERLRYVPLGWTKRYEFNESDLKSACDTIDTWVDAASMGRSNLPPEKVPWSALRTLMAQCIYGGRIDNSFDQCLLDSFLSRLFTEQSFEHDFVLVRDVDGQSGKHILVPEGTSRDELIAWSNRLPATQTPSWLGLPNNAEKVLLTNMGQEMIGNLLKMQQAVDVDDQLASEAATTAVVKHVSVDNTDTRPSWMRQLEVSAHTWKALLPKPLRLLDRTLENIADPLFRCFEREINSGAVLLSLVREDLENVEKVCSGSMKPTNYHRELMSDLAKGLIPQSWRRYTVPSGLTVIQWINDFVARVRQLMEISQAVAAGGTPALRGLKIWLGGLFMPEAYITATRQAVAQSHSWALEELFLSVELVPGKKDVPTPADNCSFVVCGLRLMGAEPLDSKTIRLSSSIVCEMPCTILRWIRIVKDKQQAGDSAAEGEGGVQLPVYLNASRSVLLFTLTLQTKETGSDFYKRGVAILSSQLG